MSEKEKSGICTKEVILTGDRPSGKLHLGHYVGSLMNRVKLQDNCEQYIMIADVQALTDNFEHPEKIRDSVYEVMLDYLAVGIDPVKSTILLQSLLPALPELTVYFMNLVTVARLERNPTVKAEIKQKNLEKSLPVGFFVYPISQVADIAGFKATLVPVGHDQLPMIEQTNEVVRSFNRIYKTEVFVEAQPLVSQAGRLVGIDGQAKMSKSLNNAMYLSDSADEITKKVRAMYTDPKHIRVEDPGSIEGNTVFTYLDIFARDKQKVAELKSHYQRGGLGDSIVKNYLIEELQELLEPIRIRRAHFAQDKAVVLELLMRGTAKARTITDSVLAEAKRAMCLEYK